MAFALGASVGVHPNPCQPRFFSFSSAGCLPTGKRCCCERRTGKMSKSRNTHLGHRLRQVRSFSTVGNSNGKSTPLSGQFDESIVRTGRLRFSPRLAFRVLFAHHFGPQTAHHQIHQVCGKLQPFRESVGRCSTLSAKALFPVLTTESCSRVKAGPAVVWKVQSPSRSCDTPCAVDHDHRHAGHV